MTREEAKREIDSLDYYLQNHTGDYGEESHTAMMMAIKALEQEPCEDCVSREAFITRYKEWTRSERGKIPNDDTLAIRVIKSLPSVTLTRKIGKWEDCGEREPWYRCSECQEKTWGSYKKYCPNCGAEMECD